MTLEELCTLEDVLLIGKMYYDHYRVFPDETVTKDVAEYQLGVINRLIKSIRNDKMKGVIKKLTGGD